MGMILRIAGRRPIVEKNPICQTPGYPHPRTIFNMGLENFLVGSGTQTFANIEDAIENLRDASSLFVTRIGDGDMARAGKISLRAFECFDPIVSELLRIRDDRKSAQTYAGTTFEQKMQALAASEVVPVSTADQAAVASAGPGFGCLPTGRLSSPISLEKTLNKIKHRHRTILNFRIESGRHKFVVCPNRPDSIVEFDVVEFCDLCRDAYSAL